MGVPGSNYSCIASESYSKDRNQEEGSAYAEQKKADWILNGGIEKEWDSYLKKMEQYGLSDYLSIKQKYFDQYQKSLSEEK